jgi:hypothetical protein
LCRHCSSRSREFAFLLTPPAINCIEIGCLQDDERIVGAIQRMSNFWDVYSLPEKGTAILARVASISTTKMEEHSTDGIVSAKTGETESGDDWGVQGNKTFQTIVMADGLGHGPDAATASRAAVEVLTSAHPGTAVSLLEDIDAALRSTRGAAVAVVQCDREERRIVFAGLGNIAARLCEPGKPAQHLISMHGTAGVLGQNRFREFSYPWPEDAVLILHSDGIATRWDGRDYPGLLNRDAALIAGVIYRDFLRRTDDASIVAVK